MKKIAVINDLSGFGKCSLTASIPVISAMGVEAHPLPTAVLSNQTAFESYKCKSLTDCILPFVSEWKKLGIEFDAVLTGFATDEAQLDCITEAVKALKGKGTVLVVDPVMADNGALYDGYNFEMCKKVIELCRQADIITPNIAELAFIADMPYSEKLEDIKSYIIKIYNEKGIKKIVATGYTDKDKIINVVFDNGEFYYASSRRQGGYFSGTGDIFASIVAAGAVKGMSLADSACLAARFIEKAVAATDADGDGNYGVYFERVLGELYEK